MHSICPDFYSAGMELKFNVSEKIQCGVANKLGGRVFFLNLTLTSIYIE